MVYGLGQLLSEESASGPVYLQADQVGSPNFLTDATGVVVGRSKNLPFGERFGNVGVKSTRRFTNHEEQDGSAIYMQARTYLPAYGKFAQVDPAYDQTKDDPESWNLYNYVTNNPVTHTDPDGRAALESTHTDSEGNVIHVDPNDGDKGIYRHDDIKPGDKFDPKKLSKTGKGVSKMGESWHMKSFLNEKGEIESGTRIEFGKSFDTWINKLHASGRSLSLLELKNASKLGQSLDFKSRFKNVQTGRLLYGRYASARDAGNFLFGMNAFFSSDGNKDMVFRQMGAYNVLQSDYSKWAQIMVGLHMETYGSAPYYGERFESGLMVDYGWANSEMRFHNMLNSGNLNDLNP